jgi:hypothetical protein
MADEWYSILQREFNAKEGSFLLQLRCDLVWDRTAFTRLTGAMLDCCKAYDTANDPPTTAYPGSQYYDRTVPRWLAEGFWYVASFVRGHTSHPAWREKIALDPDYYDSAYERLDLLADWFFSGQCPFRDPDEGFAPM